MPHRLCSECQKPGRLLVDASQYAAVDYYRCDICGHVWSHQKSDPNGPATPVTKAGPKTPQSQQ